MGIKSKHKGNRYERRCATLLIDFTGESFRRIPSSGAFNKFGGVKVAEHVFSGDLICDKADLKFSIEAKSQKVFSFVALLKDPEKTAFTKWWQQCVEDAISVNRMPMLMFKPDIQEDFVGITEDGMTLLEIPEHAPHFGLNIYGHSTSNSSIQLPTPKIFRWKTFASMANPSKMFGGTDGLLRKIECETDTTSAGENGREERSK